MDTVRPGEPLVAGYDGVVCDLDGVVYRGSDADPRLPMPSSSSWLGPSSCLRHEQRVARAGRGCGPDRCLRGPRDGLRTSCRARRRVRSGWLATSSRESIGPRPGWRRCGRGPEGARPRPRLPGWRCRRGCRRLCRAPGIRQRLRVSHFESAARVLTTGLLWADLLGLFDEDVVEAVVAVDDARALACGDARRERRRELGEAGHLARAGPLQLGGPAPDLPLEEPLGVAEVGEAHRGRVHRVQVGEGVDEPVRDVGALVAVRSADWAVRRSTAPSTNCIT